TGRMISVFKTEGNLITGLGALLGLIVGVTICLIQEKFGIVTLGDGSYIVEAYPVQLVFKDIVLILAIVLFIGYVASYFPVRYLVKKLS
ncbi:MAG: ABC transporter permease, partial [Odoribacter sp.]|nr:ABC transporter permease [Odoribacter sp.]